MTSRVHSPTFTLVNEYGGGRLRLFHLDLYRLETPEQIHRAGLEEYWQPDGVAVIEWADKVTHDEWQSCGEEPNHDDGVVFPESLDLQIGRASCRERV